MKLDEKLQELLRAPADPNARPIWETPVDEVRRQFQEEVASIDKAGPAMREVTHHPIEVDGGFLSMRRYAPESLPREEGNPSVVFYHGGGWIQGNLETHDSMCRVLAHHGACLVFSVDYRLAPEHPFPVPFQDSVRALEWIHGRARELGGDPERIGVAGDSAGGNLAAAVAIEARDRADVPLVLQLLLYPVLDLTSDTESKRRFAKGYWLDTLPFLIESYAPSPEDRADPRASPLLARDLSGLARAHVVTAGFDPLRDEGQAYAERLAASGVDTSYRCYESMIHGFFSLRGILDFADQALVELGSVLRAM